MRTRNVLAVAAVLAILLSGGSRTQLAQRAAAKGEGVVGYQSGWAMRRSGKGHDRPS